MNDLDWILGKDVDTGHTIRKVRRRGIIAKKPSPPLPDVPELPDTFFRDIFTAGLSPQEADVVSFLHSVGTASVFDLAKALFGAHAETVPHQCKQVRVVLSHIRRKLRPFGYTIHTPVGGWSGHVTASLFFLKPYKEGDRG